MNPSSDNDPNWAVRRASFDRFADVYDAYRPGYPEALVDYIVQAAGLAPDSRILEIGSGTGKATEGFARRGYRLLCIEPAPRMLDVARAKFGAFPRVEFVNARFEDWKTEPDAFDLAVCGQAFHWLRADVAFAKTAAALRDGGHLALFWNRPLPDAGTQAAVNAVFERCAPQMAARPPGTAGELAESEPRNAGQIEASGLFGPVDFKRFRWSQRLTTEQFVGGMRTHSDVQTLPAESQRCLLEGLTAVVDGFGGYVDQDWQTVLYLAAKLRGAALSRSA